MKYTQQHHEQHEMWTLALCVAILVFGAVINFILNQHIATELGAARYGDFSIATRMLNFWGIISVLGFSYFIPVELPRMVNRNLKQGVGLIVSLFKILHPIALFVLFAGIILLPLLFFAKYNKTLAIFEDSHPFAYFVWAIPIFGLYKYCRSVINSLGLGVLAFVLDTLLLPVLTFFLFLVLVDEKVGTEQLMFAPIIASLLGLIFLVIFFVIYCKRKHIALTGTKYNINRQEVIKVSATLLIATYFVTQNTTLVLLITEIFGKNEESVGFVAACFSCLSATVYCVMGSLTMILAPKLSQLLHNSNYKASAQKYLTRTHIMCGTIATLMCVALYVYAPQLLAGFGAEFKDNQIPITMLHFCVATLFPLFFIYYIDITVQARKENAFIVLNISIWYCVLVVLLAIPLVYYLHGFGAIAAVVIAQFIYYIFYITVLHRREGLWPLSL